MNGTHGVCIIYNYEQNSRGTSITAKNLANILPPTTAAIHPQRSGEDFAFLRNTYVTGIILGILIVAGLGFRMYQLGAESFGEDELNKLETVQDYLQNGLSGNNGEHPFLMKGLQTASLVVADRLNSNVLSAEEAISPETALRFPVAFIGAFTTLILFLLVRELFGKSIGLASAALWAVEPMAIGFDRVAKEDSLLLFFFLLTCFFWVRSQTLAERGENFIKYVWLTGVAFAAVMATKYNPWLLATPAAYYTSYDKMASLSRWGLGGRRWLMFFGLMGVVFLVLNPTILIPQSWHEMVKFSSEGRIAHDSYEFMG
ncbi:MAG: glycosyltransferase family 39 protein, partial [Acidobacteria bacterium]|nr:glycosyltransferase family 39 protein [Acidobacteriota bacterium]